MNLEEIKNDPEPWLHDDEKREWLIAEVERLQGLRQKWGEEFGRADRHRFVAEQRAEKAEAELEQTNEYIKVLTGQREAVYEEGYRAGAKKAFKQGWNDALECMEAEKGVEGYPAEAQFENCWYAYECDLAQTKEDEG